MILRVFVYRSNVINRPSSLRIIGFILPAALFALLSGCASTPHTGVVLHTPTSIPERLQAGNEQLPRGDFTYRIAPLDSLLVEINPVRGEVQKADYGNEIRIEFQYNGTSYRIIPNDMLGLILESESDRELPLLVRPDGFITLPRLGVDVKAAGQTVPELAKTIAQQYASLIRDPEITLSVTKSSLDKLSSLSGNYTVDRDGRLVVPTLGVFNVLGLTSAEMQKQLSIVSQDQYLNPIRVSVALNERLSGTPDTRVHPSGRRYFSGQLKVSSDGSIFIPDGGMFAAEGKTLGAFMAEVKERLQKQYQNPIEVHVSLADSPSLNVYVGGEVRQPGRYPFYPNMTVLQLLASAGWVNDTADLDRVNLVHQTSPGQYAIYVTNLREALQNKPSTYQNLRISPRDMIIVPKTDVAVTNTVIDQYIRRMLPFGATFNYTIIDDKFAP